jgi:diguanylate cyclase (GGDEF)-like protein/PAS domain S-box-containing protein
MTQSQQPQGAARSALAQDWARALATTAYLPMSGDEIHRLLLGLVDGIADELLADGRSSNAAEAAGAVLIANHATGQRSLLCTLEILGTGLHRLPELDQMRTAGTLAAGVLHSLGALAAGYADALRRKTFEQQEDVKRALERVLRLSEARFREVFTASAIGTAISDLDGTLVQTNRALADILGYPESELRRRNLHDLLAGPSGDQLRGAYQDVVNGRVDRFRLQRPLRRKEGDEAWVILSVAALRDEHGAVTHHVTMVEDITDLHLLQVQLNNQALHDVLTGLPNRQSFALRLETTLGHLDPSALVTLIQLDIDSFSVVNDGFGHETGDRLLQTVAKRLQDIFADERAVLARIAGDEFAVLIENSSTTPSVATIATRINEELSEPVYLDGAGMAVTACIGIVQRQAGGIRPAELLRQSDTTLRHAKSNGKRQWALFDPQQDVVDRERFTMAAGMPGAMEHGQFRVEYQPLVRLSDHAVVAVEALLCWDHPEQGTLRHGEVVDLAEQIGMVLPLGEWMLRTACDQVVRWRRRLGKAAPQLALNLAAAQANDPDLVGMVNRVLSGTGLAAEGVQLGLPVRALLCEEGDAEDNLQVLAEMGVQTSIHGFGGGHGGLVFLEDLPVRSVRIAGWLVQRLAERPESVTGRALTDLISLVHTFDATVIIAGVQTEEQAHWWAKVGADVACGDWFAAPAPPEAITARLLGAQG